MEVMRAGCQVTRSDSTRGAVQASHTRCLIDSLWQPWGAGTVVPHLKKRRLRLDLSSRSQRWSVLQRTPTSMQHQDQCPSQGQLCSRGSGTGRMGVVFVAHFFSPCFLWLVPGDCTESRCGGRHPGLQRWGRRAGEVEGAGDTGWPPAQVRPCRPLTHAPAPAACLSNGVGGPAGVGPAVPRQLTPCSCRNKSAS